MVCIKPTQASMEIEDAKDGEAEDKSEEQGYKLGS